MKIIRDNIIPVVFALLLLGVFCGIYYYITADMAAYRPEQYDGHSRMQGRVESEESVVVEDTVSLAEYYREPEFSDTVPELEVGEFATAAEDKLLQQWLEE